MGDFKIYLSGAIKNTPLSFQEWRDAASELLDTCSLFVNVKVLDPNVFFNYTEKLPKTEKQCLDLFMWLVDKSDLVLVNLDYSNQSCGTCMEIERAFCHNKPIISFGSTPQTWYSWARERSTVIFDTLEDAIQYVWDAYAII